MAELRWILLGLGVIVIAGIYFLRGRKVGLRLPGRNRVDELEKPRRREPGFSNDDSVQSFSRLIEGSEDTVAEPMPDSVEEPEASRASDAGRQVTPETNDARAPQMIVVLHVAARGSQRFVGEEVVSVLQSEGLKHGRFKIFHWHPADSSESVFSVASMVEPGSFDLTTVSEMTTPGLSLFLVLPGPADAAESFSQMLITARNLAQKLGGEVLDEQGSSLSNQTAGHIREEIVAFQLRLRTLEDMHA